MSTLFISDLHLHEERPDILRAFAHFMEHDAAGCDALYILGDFFDAWVGDDDESTLIVSVCRALKGLADSGTPVYLQRGNRDFLLGERFAERCGAQLLRDSFCITPYGEPLLLLHGDQLCLADTDYQAFRRQVREPLWQRDFLAKPLDERRAIARQLRQQSQAMGQEKSQEIMDVTPEEVKRVMRDANCQTLIHGHTHRPASHRFELDGEPAQRIVLGDWDKRGWFLEWNRDNSHRLHGFPITHQA
ncbi:UDP-2,3-diacylglucosamine diphosphatase [Motiliproteus sp. SC1-56]|uniref:UDP-2,3-diacylglucosamine diphosphatase n=1 Tax=Motiliproteus sp. SC1-56 TaxID=2799565 RepID=UPI001A8CB639|nr:UDP-2,3-diacylglucosamine diphosphatase [Motiliproteus sp. SC1-56]